MTDRLTNGQPVRTTESKADLNGWTAEGVANRRWGVLGVVVAHHDAHGLTYEVRFLDDSIGFYQQDELEIIVQHDPIALHREHSTRP
jgi:hypothetical protein